MACAPVSFSFSLLFGLIQLPYSLCYVPEVTMPAVPKTYEVHALRRKCTYCVFLPDCARMLLSSDHSLHPGNTHPSKQWLYL